MQPKKDNTNENSEFDELSYEESTGSSKKAKIRKVLQISIAIAGIGFMIYNMFFTGEAQDEKVVIKSPKVKKEEINEARALIEATSKSVVPQDAPSIIEFKPGTQEIPKIAPPKIDVPEVPPLPKIEFDPPPKKSNPIESVKNDNTPAPLSQKNDEKVSMDLEKTKDLPNPDKIVASKTEKMFEFSDGSGGSPSLESKSPGQKSSTKRDDFIIYDKTKLIEESKESDDKAKNVTVTQGLNLENLIAQGKIIDVILETAINSQLPGNIRGIVSRDVFAEAGQKVLIPKGTRVYGSYSSTVQRGLSRLNITWNRVLRPDGVAVSGSMVAADQFGRTGIEGDVDNRFGEMFSNSLLLSFVNLGTAVALQKITGTANNGQTQVVNSNGSVATTNINPVNLAAQSVIQNTSDIVNQLTQGATALQPIVTLPQGTRIKVLVNQDIQLPDYAKKTINAG